MTPAPQKFWETLFTSPAEPAKAYRVQMRLLRKGGRPFLLLPPEAQLAAATMALYPAQTVRARAARMLLRWLLRASLAPGAEAVTLTLAADDPFARFLASQAGQTVNGLPRLGILAGNPMSEGQRLLLVVFDDQDRPVTVVKVGMTEQAKALIAKESSFLSTVPAGLSGIPKLRAVYESSCLHALALDFFAGDSPRPPQEAALPELLESWVEPNQTVRLSDTADWARLQKAAAGISEWSRIAGQLSGRSVQATVAHGDLAPWNIKVSPAGGWTILDWERGELRGIPGWDWFHYVIQSAILVRHMPLPALVRRVGELLASERFRQYAARAGIAGCERELLGAYLLHMVEVVKPSEGLAATRELLRAHESGLSSPK